MFTGTGLFEPTFTTCLSCSTLSSFACDCSDRFPISSRKRVPLSADSNLPFLSSAASVKAPFTCPNSSLSNNVSVTDPISTLTISSPDRRDRLWISLATSSFPVPFSPVISTFASVAATFLTMFITLIIVGEAPRTILSPPLLISFFSCILSCRRFEASSLELRSCIAILRVARSLVSLHGFII